MTTAQIEKNLIALISEYSEETFIYDLLLAYNLPKASITRLKKGNLNLSKEVGEISWKKKLLFKELKDQDPHVAITDLLGQVKHNQRFVIVTDYEILLAVDMKTEDRLDIELKELPRHYDFFLPWAGMEKAQHASENPADVKAAERMAKLFDEIKKDNPDESPAFIHNLNVFLSRLLFCFFAEDTNIFSDNQFTNAISSHTQADGSDLGAYLDVLFEVLNTPNNARKNIPAYLEAFPYVNGGLFEKAIKSPMFTRKSRQAIIASGELDWKAINPDIFGSMFQAVIGADQRGSLGQHYTSVPNIMKVIEPLFLNDLYEELDKANGNSKKLNALLNRVKRIKIFDPACGSGNFLIIAYKELRRLEMKIFKASGELALSGIQLSQLYGIEIHDFAHEIAQLALWLAEHQMNVEFFNEFGRTNPTLPLKTTGKIVQANACRIDWEEVCPKEEGDEIYILGNPPYLGFKMQNGPQKSDIALVFKEIKGYKKLDYISCWFFKGSKFICGINGKFAFVSTNSICQGEHASLLWPNILDMALEIFFAYPSFKWSNNAKDKAAVICCIPGIRNVSRSPKFLLYDDRKLSCDNINVYLSPVKTGIVYKRSKALSDFPKMFLGNMPKDDGNLIMSSREKEDFLVEFTNSTNLIKELVGAYEFLNGGKRWCLWINEKSLNQALSIEPIRDRIEKVRKFRLASSDKSANKMALTPYKFREQHLAEVATIMLPTVTSQRRHYIPLGYLRPDQIVVAPNNAVYDPESHLFGILSSKMHMVWMRMFSGKLKTDYRYSSALCYNSFPFPNISAQRKQEITQCVFRILEEREKHPDKTLAQLYDPDKMPEGLREAHHANDIVIEKCYRSRPFESDEERLEYLFKLYEKMIEEENTRNTLFAAEKKTKKKK